MSGQAAGQQFLFSAGNLFMIDSSGTPREATVIQSAELDFATSTKSLQDTFKVAKLVALADLKISGKFAAAEWSAETMAMGLAGCATVTSGTQYKMSNEETATLSSTVLSFTAANATGFQQDLGVDNISSVYALISMNKYVDITTDGTGVVPTGCYKVVNGVYTFNTADCAAGLTVKVKYMYKTTTDGGRLLTINNSKQGLATYYQMFLSGTLVNQLGIAEQANIWLFAVTCNKLGISMKIGDFNYPSYEYQAFSTAANTIGYMSLGGSAA